MDEVIIKRFEDPDERREFQLGSFELISVAGTTIGRATYQPGWKWSEHVGADTGETSCRVEHVGYVVEGTAVAAMDDGRIIELQAGSLFYVPPGHDSWVIGDQVYRSIHLHGAEDYATE